MDRTPFESVWPLDKKPFKKFSSNPLVALAAA
jgi:hypothetical protein